MTHDLAAAARATAAGDGDAAERAALAALATASGEQVQAEAALLLTGGLQRAWAQGWQPDDLHELVVRRLTREHADLLAVVVAAAAAPAGPLHPRWAAQLGPLPDGEPLAAWQRAARSDLLWSLVLAVELLALLDRLPRLEVLLPPPGQHRPGGPVEEHVDRKVLKRVRALLAKAESTEFDEEAEALSAKAQELVARHSLDLLVHEGDRVPVVSGRRLWLETPYAPAKALLVAAVGEANRCAVVWTEDPGFATVLGDERDLEVVELLVTSLLVQAGRAVLHGGPRKGEEKRTYRQSFLVAYAQRVGERLREATAHAATEVGGAALVPLVAAHLERVQQARDEVFPVLRSRSVSVRHEEGWLAGRDAADGATLTS